MEAEVKVRAVPAPFHVAGGARAPANRRLPVASASRPVSCLGAAGRLGTSAVSTTVFTFQVAQRLPDLRDQSCGDNPQIAWRACAGLLNLSPPALPRI